MDKPSSGASAARSSFSLSQQDIKIKPEDLARPLGQGGFGIVYKGTHQFSPAAIKELLIPKLSAKELKAFTQEAEIMADLRHANIIQLYGFTETAPYRIVMEFMPKGSLYDVLRDTEDLSWTQKITWGIEIGAGLHYLHTRTPQIIHRDLKSLNVLISKDNTAKLTDFGLALAKLRTTTSTLTSSAKAKKAEEPTGAVGSTRWMAPELFADLDPTYNPATDIFAYAIVLWELAAQEIPYSSQQNDVVIKDLIQQGKRATIQPDWPEGFKSLIARCWDQAPKQRPSAEKVVEALTSLLEEEDAEAKTLSQSTHSLSVTAPTSRGYALSSDAAASGKATQSQGYALASERPASVAKVIELVPPPKPLKIVAAEPKPAETTTPTAPAFFAATAKLAVKQTDVEKLLLHVAQGEQNEAEELLKIKGNEALLLHKGKVTDYSNRTFKNITAFQYTLWALDWHMWKMILKYLPKKEAAQQLKNLESKKTEHGAHYDFTPLVEALKTYVDNYNSWSYYERENHWIKGVGGAQTQVPAHVANEYCRPDRSFDPKPSFTEDTLPRIFTLYSNNKFFPLYKHYLLGSLSSDFGILRAYRLPLGERRCAGTSADLDRRAISELCEVRTQQYQALEEDLRISIAIEAQPISKGKRTVDTARSGEQRPSTICILS